MDQMDAARVVMTRHHPRRLLAALRILRCARRCGRWPCEHWLNADAEKRRIEAQLAVQRITDMIGRPPAYEPITLNRGPR